jgi:ribosomal protein S7
MELTLKLTEQEINLVVDSLAKRPYEIVFQLINKIIEQGNKQVSNNIQHNDQKDTKEV